MEIVITGNLKDIEVKHTTMEGPDDIDQKGLSYKLKIEELEIQDSFTSPQKGLLEPNIWINGLTFNTITGQNKLPDLYFDRRIKVTITDVTSKTTMEDLEKRTFGKADYNLVRARYYDEARINEYTFVVGCDGLEESRENVIISCSDKQLKSLLVGHKYSIILEVL